MYQPQPEWPEICYNKKILQMIDGTHMNKVIGLSLALILLLPFSPARADSPDISIALDQPTTVIGRTVSLFIQIVNLSKNTIQPTHFECIADGTSLSVSSTPDLPPAIAHYGSFTTNQSFVAVAAGTTNIHCELTATDSVTGEQIMESSPVEAAKVLAETRLAFDTASSANDLQVGDTVAITESYINHGDVPFTDVNISCAEAGRSLRFVQSTPTQTTLQPGESVSIVSMWQAFQSGAAPLFCSITATDSSTGQQVTIPAPTLNIEVQ
jgi:hypothetical protein